MPKKKQIANWGNYPKIEAEVHSNQYLDELQQIVQASETILPRGNGRCYGDAALHATVFSTLRLNKILDFDAKTGTFECQAGMLLSDILNFIVPRGFFLPVTPGTKFITLGGALAANVHGKNHHSEGCFSKHVIHFDLMNGAGEVIRCSRNENATIFWNTFGAMGLTGIILSAKFSLKKIETAYIRQETIKVKNLQELMQLFEDSKDWTYTVSWIDLFQTGNQMGRSLLMRGEHALLMDLPANKKSNPLVLKTGFKKRVPFNFPSVVLNKWTVKIFNFLFYRKQFQAQKTQIIPYDKYFYPLDTIHHWNRIYGKNGFTQYQFVLPKAASEKGLVEILETIRRSGQGSFLTVLKLFGNNEKLAINSFPMEGYTLALDFKITKTLPRLITDLDQLILKYGGKIYRAKDAFSDKRLSQLPLTYEDQKFASMQQQRLE